MNCPICGDETLPEMRPFCSKRCADRDLARWFNGRYAVPSSDPEDIDALEEALDAAAQAQERQDKPH